MAQEPSLGEITSIRPEATVNPGVILDGRDAVRELNQSAQFNAEMKQKGYAMGLDNLKGIYQDLGAIENTPVLQEDRPILNQKMATVLNELAEDPHAALGGGKFNEIQRQLGELRSLATTSKQDNIYDQFHQKVLENDPSLATSDNKGKVDSFVNQPLGARKKYLLDTPVKFDPEAAMGKILSQKQVAVPYAETGFDGPNNEWMTRTTGTTYGRDAALNLWNQGYDTGSDANNQPIKKWANEQFDRIKNDPSQLEKFGNPKDAREFYQNLGKQMYGANEDIVADKTSTRTANPYSMLSKRQNFSLYMEGIKEGNREKLAAVKANLRLQGAPENANFLVRTYANILGNTTGKTNAVDVGGNKYETEDVISVPQPILKNYAQAQKETLREGRSADPITETIVEGNTPDLTTRTKDGNLRLTFYKHYNKTDKIPFGKNPGDLVTDSKGNPVIDKTGVIPKRNLLATLGKGVVETKILASSIDEADQVLRGKSNAVLDKINSGEDDGTAISVAGQEAHKESKKTYSLGGKTFTMDQIQKGAKKYGLSVQDYIKQTGMQ